jgi:hypothetical protein
MFVCEIRVVVPNGFLFPVVNFRPLPVAFQRWCFRGGVVPGDFKRVAGAYFFFVKIIIADVFLPWRDPGGDEAPVTRGFVSCEDQGGAGDFMPVRVQYLQIRVQAQFAVDDPSPCSFYFFYYGMSIGWNRAEPPRVFLLQSLRHTGNQGPGA